MRLSPADPHTFTMRTATAAAHFVAGRPETALAWAEQVAWERPGFVIAAIVVAAAAGQAGRPDVAGRTLERLAEIEPGLRLANLRDYWPVGRAADLERWREGLRRAGFS